MNKAQMMKELAWIENVYPAVRLVKDIPFRTPDKRTKRAEWCNYYSVRQSDIVRYWLYKDLLPDAPLTKVRAWFGAYIRCGFGVFNEALEAVYEMCRRDELQTLTVSQFKAALRKYGLSPNLLLGPTWPRVEALLLTDLTERKDAPLSYGLVIDVFQWTRLSARISLDNPSLEEACQLSFAENQKRLERIWSTPDAFRDETVIPMMRKILKRWINDKGFRPQCGHHGSGAVAEPEAKRSASRKCKYLLATDDKLRFFVRKFDLDVYADLPSSRQTPRTPLIRSSRWLTVPKNISKRRGIAPQPAVLMWYQQGILDALYEQVWCQPYIQEHFPIFNREVNRRIALSSSRYDHWSTYDLSNASDSVTVHLVKRVFGPNLRCALLCCRCVRTTEHAVMHTYGTMGDATVFPTETLVIGAALLTALILARVHDSRVKLTQFTVFGDDICAQNLFWVHQMIHQVFAALGFLINDEKSFLTGRYRESCGLEAYYGVEVEPFYFLNRKSWPKDRANRIAACVSAANLCYQRGLKHCRRFFLHCLEIDCFKMEYVPFTTDPADTSKVLTSVITDRGRYRRNPDLQCPERLMIQTVSRTNAKGDDLEMEQWYRYYMYLLDPPDRPSTWDTTIQNRRDRKSVV